jgi:hypothetical protein
MLELRRGLLLAACVSVGFVISAGPGLMARAAEPVRWIPMLAPPPSATATPDASAQNRIAELELRIQELEAERRAQQQVGGQRSSELAAAIARNEQLVARNLALSLENQELARAHAFDPSAPAPAVQPPSDADPRAQLRYWAKQLREGETTFRRLPPDWNAAVNVLLRRERELDPQNPWRAP